MNTRLFAAFLCTAGSLLANPSDYLNFVRQIQADSGVEWDVSVAASGQMLAPEGVGPGGSHFQLWAIHATTFEEYLLDEEFVSSYSPSATINVITGDPYKAVPRTRVDQPYTVEVVVEGLVPAGAATADAPAAARMVHISHEAFNYPNGRDSLDGIEDPIGLEAASGYLENNGTHELNYGSHSLTGPDLTKVRGEEVFTVSALEDAGIAAAVLAQKRLQIWPVAQGSISGIDPTTRYSELPPIKIELIDLYPKSTTFARIYFGAPSVAPQDPVAIASSYAIVNDSIPQKRSLTLDKIDDLFKKEGAHTMEVIHETPFGTDIIAQYYPVRVDRTVEFRGGLYTTE